MVKILMNKPSVTVINTEALDSKNLTAHFHKAEYYELRRKLLKSNLKINYLKNLVSKISLGNTGKIMDGYVNHGIPYLTTKNITDSGIDFSKLTYIPKEIHDGKLKNSKVYPHDILYNKSGNVGLSALIPDDFKEYNLVSDLIYIRLLEEKIDPHYLVLYLNSSVGKKLSEQQAGGAIFQHISIYDVGDLQIPIPNKNTQTYIANKVREAEKLRYEAELSKENAEKIIAETLRIEELNSKISNLDNKLWNNVTFKDITDRLDPEHYKVKFSVLDNHIKELNKSNINVLRLMDIIRKGNYGILPKSSDYGKGELTFIRSTDLKDYLIDFESCEKVPMEYNVPKAQIFAGEILLEIKGAMAEAAIVPDNIDMGIVNGSIFKFSTKTEFNNYYILGVLQSLLGELQKEKYGTNSVISYLSIDIINNLKVPIADKKTQEKVGNGFELFVKNMLKAKELIKSAKLDVEHLIEGIFDESKIH